MKRFAVIVVLLSSELVAQSIGFQVVHQPSDSTLWIDPETGLPVIRETALDTTLLFDPQRGERIRSQPARTASFPEEPSGWTTTLGSMIATAEAEALKDHHQGLHVLLGGTGCLFSWIGVPLTAFYVESGISRFDENSASLSATYYRSLPVDLQSAYKKAYRDKEKSLRRKSVYGTQGICFLAFFGLFFIGGGI